MNRAGWSNHGNNVFRRNDGKGAVQGSEELWYWVTDTSSGYESTLLEAMVWCERVQPMNRWTIQEVRSALALAEQGDPSALLDAAPWLAREVIRLQAKLQQAAERLSELHRDLGE